jgi:hypothetical protein
VTTADPFGSPKRTLARARHHIADLRSRADDFMNGRAPGTYRIERRAEGNNQHTIKFDRGFFEQLSNIAFDAGNNLRSALDQTAYATAVLAGKEKPKRAYFPIAGELSDLENLIKLNCRDLRPEIIDLFKTFQPYGRGNIWLMCRGHNLNNNRRKFCTSAVACSRAAGLYPKDPSDTTHGDAVPANPPVVTSMILSSCSRNVQLL